MNKLSIKENQKYIKSYYKRNKLKLFKPREHDKVFVKILKNILNDGDFVLDIGCGSGASTKFFQDKYPKNFFYGIDYLEKIFIKFKKKYPVFLSRNLNKKINLPIKFDLCYSKAVFQTLPETKINFFLKNCKKFTKKGGLFVLFDCFLEKDEFEIFRFNYKRDNKTKNNLKTFSFNYYSKKFILKKLQKTGFKNIKFIPFKLSFEMKGKKSDSHTLKLFDRSNLSLIGPVVQNWNFVIAKN